MTMIPNCRTDDAYNEDFLNGKDKEFVKGFDWCTEMAVDNFFDNIDTYFDEDSYLMHILNEKMPESMQYEESFELRFAEDTEDRRVITYMDLLRSKLLEWVEQERDQLITSMIDSMGDEEYQALRNKVLYDNEKNGNRKEYYDSRKAIVTGKKEYHGPDEES